MVTRGRPRHGNASPGFTRAGGGLVPSDPAGVLVRVVTRRFVAGVVVGPRGTIHESAPILARWRGRTIGELARWVSTCGGTMRVV